MNLRILSPMPRRSIRRLVSARSGLLVLFSLAAVSCGRASDEAQGAEAADQPGTPAASEASDQQDVFDLRDMGMDEGSVMTAVLAVADFSDFGCIHCADFHVNDYPAIYDEFIQPGDVLWKYIPISVGGFPNGDMAALTGICASDLGSAGAFSEIREALFSRRNDWLTATPSQARELFVSYAGELGIDADAFEACIDGDSAAEVLEHNNDTARKIGVTATPTFIVGGSPVVGAPPLSEFQRVLRQLVTQAREAQAGQSGQNGNAGSAPPDA
jgi:protein-disulfide isomerase